MTRRPERLLALDAAGRACSAALWRDGGIKARRLERMSRGQSERLIPMVQEVMAEGGLDFAALDAVAVTVGPGGFTGVRIGLAAARGLAMAWALPLIGVTCFEAVAAGVDPDERAERLLVVVLDAKRSDLYLQVFRPEGDAIGEPAALAPEAIDAAVPAGPLLLAGDGVAQSREALAKAGRDVKLSRAPALVDAANVAALAVSRALPTSLGAQVRPLYLRPPDVTPARAAAPPR